MPNIALPVRTKRPASALSVNDSPPPDTTGVVGLADMSIPADAGALPRGRRAMAQMLFSESDDSLGTAILNH
jgi:hypothetical protein